MWLIYHTTFLQKAYTWLGKEDGLGANLHTILEVASITQGTKQVQHSGKLSTTV